MPRRQTALRISLVVLAVVAVAGIAVAIAIPSEEQLARRAEQAVQEKTGVTVHIGRLHWQLLPRPMVEVTDVRTEQQAPIVIGRLVAWPRIAPLLHGELAVGRALLDGATIPQLSLRAFKGADKSGAEGQGPLRVAELPLQRAEFRAVQWVGRHGVDIEFSGDADFDPAWRPRAATLVRSGATPPARLDLHRLDGQDRWQADIAIAGGTWNGQLALQQPAPERYRITGELQPRDIELRQLLETFERKPVIAGRASGRTTLEAEGSTPGEIAQSLHTRTTFDVNPATILRFDLDKAIRSIGKDHAGTTPLDSLTGVLDTRSDPDGVVMRYENLRARSGKLSARGTVVLQNRQLDADIAVDLVDGLVGVPLRITGPTSDPRFSVPASAVAGAAVGTAVLPGVGTVLGARIGSTLGRIFGSPGETSKPASPAQRKNTAPAPARPAPSGHPQSR